MVNSSTSAPSFLRDAFNSYVPFSNPPKQLVQKQALKWLQNKIETELSDKTILEQFAQKWRAGSNDKSPLHLENLPGSYKGDKSVDTHQEDALVFLHEKVPAQLQEEFKKQWDIKAD